jgi:8-oxo-dGTP diphosphatase
VEPLAELLGLTVETVDALAEGADTTPLLGLLDSIDAAEVIMCSHGDVIPDLLDRLSRRGLTLHTPNGLLECKKASIWTVSIVAGVPTRAVYTPPL